MAECSKTIEPVLHVIVVGFHHKKGCQVEYSYPPLIKGNTVESHEIPKEWKNIPSLALPDGAHNYIKDTVYFLLPGRNGNLETVYGVSCYRQMDAKDLINRTADVTRSTVQKSVCVLSRLPLFGLIKAKLELITHAYFDERDFSQVTLLEQTYNNLNASLNQSLLEGTQVFLDLPVRQLVTTYRHKIIILFKLMLLEKRVLVFGSPVETICQTLLGVLSLFPGMLENGLGQACNQWNKTVSPTLTLANVDDNQDEDEQFLEVRYHSSNNNAATDGTESCNPNSNDNSSGGNQHCSKEPPESPTIPRDSFSLQVQDSNNENNNTKSTATSSSTQNYSEESIGSPMFDANSSPRGVPETSSDKKSDLENTDHHSQSGKYFVRRSSSNDSDKLSVHASHHRNKKESVATELESKNNDGASAEESPLAHINEITQIEAIQSGVASMDIMTTSLDNSAQRNSLTLSGTKPLKDARDNIDELDSPESLLEIDNEDCFSWEQDHLQLTLHEDAEDVSVPAKESSDPVQFEGIDLDSSVTTSKDSLHVDESEKDFVSSDSLSTSMSDSNERRSKSKLESPKGKTGKMLKEKLSAAFNKKSRGKSVDEPGAIHPVEGEVILQQDNFGHPLAIFTSGSVLYPYLSLQYHDILTDVNTRSFAIGATNVLFKQRRQLIDVLIETDDGKIEIRDKELQRQLNLTTADLRFAEYLVKTVTEDIGGSIMDGTEWEGSEEWVRAQFKYYINSLLATVMLEDSNNSKLLEDFGVSFIAAWRTTHNFRHWQKETYPVFKDIPIGHPFQGNLSVSDVRNRFNHTFQNTERGKKINAAVVQTGRYVVQTGKVVGGAITSARSAVSGWFSSWRGSNRSQDLGDGDVAQGGEVEPVGDGPVEKEGDEH